MDYKRILLALIFALASTGAMAEWAKLRSYGEKSDYASNTQYVDFYSLHKDGSMVDILDLTDFDSEQLTMPFGGKNFLSITRKYMLDCTNKRYRVLDASWFSGNMGRGDIVSRYSDGDWSKMDNADYIHEETLWEVACGKN